jgi:hypothetical protein
VKNAPQLRSVFSAQKPTARIRFFSPPSTIATRWSFAFYRRWSHCVELPGCVPTVRDDPKGIKLRYVARQPIFDRDEKLFGVPVHAG